MREERGYKKVAESTTQSEDELMKEKKKEEKNKDQSGTYCASRLSTVDLSVA